VRFAAENRCLISVRSTVELSHIVRIAVSGTHAGGKSTLIADLRGYLKSYQTPDEPYYELLEEGHDFSDPPSRADFEAQLERSIAQLRSLSAPDILFDRCPLDFLAYLEAINPNRNTGRDWLSEVPTALASLDLVVFVTLEQPERIATARRGDPLRGIVDGLLREMIVEDSYGFDLPHVEVQGSPYDRVRQVLTCVQTPPVRDSIERGLTRS
jgi:predicted ATPase